MNSSTETRTISGKVMTLRQYQAAVSAAVAGKIGLSLNDLVDYDIWSAWDSEMPIDEAAKEALLNESDSIGGMFDDLMEDLFDEE